MNKVKVVHIRNGEVREAVLETSMFGRAPAWVWWPEHLKKDGGFPSNRYHDGNIANPQQPYDSDYVLYDEAREARAQLVRLKIAALHQQITLAEDELVAVYKEAIHDLS